MMFQINFLFARYKEIVRSNYTDPDVPADKVNYWRDILFSRIL